MFEHAYCINLDSRPDRWQQAVIEFEREGLEVERIPGVIYSGADDKLRNACVGCHLSHAEILRQAINGGYHSILIMEDDIQFINPLQPTLDAAFEQLPDNWDMLYLGANIEHPMKRISANLARLSGARSTHAIVIRDSMYERLLAVNLDLSIDHNDKYYEENIIPFYNCFITIPMIAIQRESYSDILGSYVRYQDWMLERYNRWLS